MDINVHPLLTHFPLIVKIEEEGDRQFNVLAALFMVTFRGALPNGTVALHETGLFNVRPIAQGVLESSKELPDLLTPYLRGTLVHAVMHSVFGERVRDDIRVPARGHAC